MAYLVEVPVDRGGRLVVQVDEADLPGGLALAARGPGEIAARAERSLEHALEQIKPAVGAMADQLAALGPDRATLEFGLVLGAETGVVVAKGTSEVHFTVRLTWDGLRQHGRPPAAGGGGR